MAKEEKLYKKQLSDLCNFLIRFEKAMDSEMTKPSSPDRGKNIAKLMNALDIQLDSALHFGMGLSFEKIKKMKERGIRQ